MIVAPLSRPVRNLVRAAVSVSLLLTLLTAALVRPASTLPDTPAAAPFGTAAASAGWRCIPAPARD